MGEVYQARDTKLDRDVALKVLPDAFTSDPERLARFEREAKVLASLNHPNIGGIHGLEESDGVKALVLELVEGPTLADRIANGPIPLDDALPIARQMADALEAAHEQGVIHRDLKPANIKVKSDGTVKVLDFGLAKAFQPEASDPNMSLSPTISLTAAATQIGMVIGTAAYMAPEQAKGKPVDRHADVWAFGAVVYEMLSGRRAFGGGDVSDTLAMVLMKEVDWSLLPADTPASMRTLLERCLARDPKQRIRDIGDVRLAMDGAFETTVSAPPPETVRPAVRWWQRPVSLVIAGLALVAVGGLAAWTWTGSQTAPADVMRFVIEPSSDAPLGSGSRQDIAISPDGTQIVYNGRAPGGGSPQLNLRSLAESEGAPVRGSVRGYAPFLSPDGAWIGFVTQGPAATTLVKLSRLGGPWVELTESPSAIFGASWGPDDQIVFGTERSGLFRVSGGGGDAENLTTPDIEAGEIGHRWPFIIAGTDAVLFTLDAGNPTVDGQLAVLSSGTGEVKQLDLAGTSPRYVSTGHLVYAAEDGSVRAVPFDLDTLSVAGNPVPLIEGVAVKPSGAASFSISDHGHLVWVPDTAAVTGQRSLVWVDLSGQREEIDLPLADYRGPRVSPDGARAAVEIPDVETNLLWIWIADTTRGTLSRLTETETGGFSPIWTPDGQAIVFPAVSPDGRAFYRRLADGTGETEHLATIEEATFISTLSWSPDGDSLVFHFRRGEDFGDIAMLSLSDGTWRPLIDTEATEGFPAVSPDGRWLAYVSDETGASEVYVQRFPDLGGRQPISTGGGIDPVWSPDGRTLYYLTSPPVREMMAVPIDAGPPMTVGIPEALFEFRFVRPRGPVRMHDLTPDGDRFLMVADQGTQAEESDDPRRINVVLNWHTELLERVPVP